LVAIFIPPRESDGCFIEASCLYANRHCARGGLRFAPMTCVGQIVCSRTIWMPARQAANKSLRPYACFQD
jgi:hypothetical protein